MKKSQYRNFTELADKLLSVPHNKVKAKMEAEKEAKKRKQREGHK